MNHLLTISLLLTCAFSLKAQVNNYVIDPTFNTDDQYNKGTMKGFLFREEFQDIYINFRRSGGFSTTMNQSLVDTHGDFLHNVAPNPGGVFYKYRDGILATQYGGITYRLLPPHPDAGTVDNETFFFEYSKDVYSFQGVSQISRRILIFPDNTFLFAGRFSTDSINPGIQGYRYLVQIDSTGAPIEGFPDIICEPWTSIAYNINFAEDGKYWLAGEFVKVNGHETHYLARLNSNFTVDTTYVSPFLDGYGWAHIIQIDSGNNLWMGCALGCNITTGPLDGPTLVKLKPDGSVDEGFNIPNSHSWIYPETEEVLRLCPGTVFEDSDGNFILAGNIMEYNGSPVKRIFKIAPNGDLIPEAFEHLGADEANWNGWTFFYELADVTVNNIQRTPDGKLLIGGAFSSFGGEAYSCLVRLELDGFISDTDTKDTEKPGFSIWPNPSDKMFHLQVNQPVLKMDVISPNGNLLLRKSSKHLSNTMVLPSNISRGVYFIKCTFENGLTSTQKLFVR